MRIFSAGWLRRGSITQALTWAGVLLLLAGGFLAYPYASSRLAAPFGPAPTPTAPSPPATDAFLTNTSAPTVVSPAPTITSVPTPAPTPVPAPPTRLIIPAIGVDAPIVPVSWYTVEVDGEVQAIWALPEGNAVGWHNSSATLGVPGNTVLNGHNTTHGEVFRNLYKLDSGDEIIVYSSKTPYTYTVARMLVLPEAGQPLEVRIENARYIQPTDDERLTLVTCHPYGSLRNRLIVIAFPKRERLHGP